MSKNFLHPDRKASSIGLIALVVLMNSLPAHAEVSFGPGPSPRATIPAKPAPAALPDQKAQAASGKAKAKAEDAAKADAKPDAKPSSESQPKN